MTVSEARSRNMRAIHSKNTGPEVVLRKKLFQRGFRYRLHVCTLPGTPDIVLPKYRTAIFVNGCFWHRHGCRYTTTPKTNRSFWENKFSNNVARDIRIHNQLALEGWRVATIWECALQPRLLDGTAEVLADFLCGDGDELEI